MSGDISPLRPVSITPLVREKRHYPGDQKENSRDKQEKDELDNNTDAEDKESTEDMQQKNVNIDKNNVTVGHIDEYA